MREVHAQEGAKGGSLHLLYSCTTEMWLSVLPKYPSTKVRETRARLEESRGGGQQVGAKDLSGPEADLFPTGFGVVPLPLQVRMTCRCKANGQSSTSWEFGFHVLGSLLFDSESGKYTVVHPEGERMKAKWESEEDLTRTFAVISQGHCGDWLTSLVRWETLVGTTGN